MAPVIIVPGNNTVRSIGSHVWMALGLGTGLGLGVAAAMTRWPSLLALTQWLRPLGTLFLNLLSMVVIPLVATARSEEHTSELQSQSNLVCRLLLEKKKKKKNIKLLLIV